jgi:tubulin--tyrosine ligase-like protein 12
MTLYTIKYPECDISFFTFLQSRALYAADLMLEWVNRESGNGKVMEPRLLEVNFIPDCVRACKYHPDFFNHVFEVLFFDQNSRSKDLPVTQLL